MTADLTKPEIDAPQGPAPAELVVRDIVVGDGAEAKPGDTVTVHYVGVEYDSGEEFDVIPPPLAYGPAGGHFLGGKTLIFVIDLMQVG